MPPEAEVPQPGAADERSEPSRRRVPAPEDGRPGGGVSVWVLAGVVVLLGLDLWTKAAVFDWLGPPGDPGHRRHVVLGDWLAIWPQTNAGAAFGRFKDWPHALVTGRVIAVLLLFWLLWRTERERRWLRLALTLVVAGALGNLYDNLFLPAPEGKPFGEVRDFIDVYFTGWDYHFPTFNVADSCITVGAVLLLLTSLGRREEPAAEGAAEPADAGGAGQPGQAREPAA